MTKTLQDYGERKIIDQFILPLLSTRTGVPFLLDDCAMLDVWPDRYLLVSTDQIPNKPLVLQFGGTYQDVGHYAVTANVSDIAAMGGKPIGIMLALSMKKDTPVDQMTSFLDGIHDAVKEYDICLLGGDTKEGPSFTATITVLGEVRKEQVLRREGAKVGDMIFITGRIGAFFAKSIQNYQVAKREGSKTKIVRPQARIEQGIKIANSGLCTSCMDMSDGLIGSLKELGQTNKLCYSVDLDRLPIEHLSSSMSTDPNWEESVLNQGGDFDLIFTLKDTPHSLDLGKSIDATHVGYVNAGDSDLYEIRGYTGKLQPYEHFLTVSNNIDLLRGFLQ